MTEDRERATRRTALAVLGGMVVIWIVLGGASFVPARHRPDPEAVTFRGRSAVEGKRDFQAYNCMDCHTMVGNGAYFAPDLTFVYRKTGPAWLSAFLSSAGAWPTGPVVDLWIDRLHGEGALPQGNESDYYRAYPGALQRVQERGGRRTLMPNLPFSARQIEALVAFLDYTSRLDTEGWPPATKAGAAALARERAALAGTSAPAPAGTAAPAASPAGTDPVTLGRQTAMEMGCVACHSLDGTRLVGPSWKGLYGSAVPLSDGTTVKADEAYLIRSILDPNAQVVQGFKAGLMPSFRGRLSDQQVHDLAAYIESAR